MISFHYQMTWINFGWSSVWAQIFSDFRSMYINNLKFYCWLFIYFPFRYENAIHWKRKGIKQKNFESVYNVKILDRLNENWSFYQYYKIISIFFWSTLYNSNDIRCFELSCIISVCQQQTRFQLKKQASQQQRFTSVALSTNHLVRLLWRGVGLLDLIISHFSAIFFFSNDVLQDT